MTRPGPFDADLTARALRAALSCTDRSETTVPEPRQAAESSRVLDCPMDPARNDANAATVREYLVELLAELWKEGEAFSGKRPFGNSGWEWDIYTALVAAGLIEGAIDEDGYLDDVDQRAADRLVLDAIKAIR